MCCQFHRLPALVVDMELDAGSVGPEKTIIPKLHDHQIHPLSVLVVDMELDAGSGAAKIKWFDCIQQMQYNFNILFCWI